MDMTGTKNQIHIVTDHLAQWELASVKSLAKPRTTVIIADRTRKAAEHAVAAAAATIQPLLHRSIEAGFQQNTSELAKAQL